MPIINNSATGRKNSNSMQKISTDNNQTSINPPNNSKKTVDAPTMDFKLKEPKYKFSDIVLSEQMKNEILDALSSFEFNDKLFKEWNLASVIKKPMSLCMNFYGEPGTGKTMVANAVASHLGHKVIRVEYSDIESKYVGETSKNLTRLFEEANEKNAVIIFDEADALLSKRVTDMSSANDVSVNQTRSVLLTLMDDYKGILVFTTNFISNFDSAFMRRIPYNIKFDFPNEEVRLSLLNYYLTNTVPHDINTHSIAKKYGGITGADIANALMSSALKTARANKTRLSHEDFENAIISIIKGKEANKGHKNAKVTDEVVSEEEALSVINRQK